MTEFVRLPKVPTKNQIEAAAPILSDAMSPARARRVLHQIYETFIDMRPDVAHPKGMTAKMAQLLEIILEYQEEHGYPPTQYELADLCQLDRTTIRNRLHAMRRRGVLQIKPGYRGIIVIRQS